MQHEYFFQPADDVGLEVGPEWRVLVESDLEWNDGEPSLVIRKIIGERHETREIHQPVVPGGEYRVINHPRGCNLLDQAEAGAVLYLLGITIKTEIECDRDWMKEAIAAHLGAQGFHRTGRGYNNPAAGWAR